MSQHIACVLTIHDPKRTLPTDRAGLEREIRRLVREQAPNIDLRVLSVSNTTEVRRS